MMSFRGRAQTIARNTCSQLGKDMLWHVELCKSFGEIVCMHVVVLYGQLYICTVHVFITYATCMMHNICKLSHDIKHFVLQFWAIPSLAVGTQQDCPYYRGTCIPVCLCTVLGLQLTILIRGVIVWCCYFRKSMSAGLTVYVQECIRNSNCRQ